MSINKENLQKQIEEMKVKLADMEAELNKPDVVINYWQPTEYERYYYINYYGLVDSSMYETKSKADKVRYRVFKTEAEAEKYAEYVKAEETLRRVIAEVNEGWIPDWSYGSYKYVVGIEQRTGYIKVLQYTQDKLFPSFMYINSRELAEKLIKEYEVEFKTYLSY